MQRWIIWAAAAAAAAAGATASAQSYPAKPIRIVVPFVPGGPSDTVGRAIGSRFLEYLGQPAIVENRPGANGAIAAEFVAKSDPDGYTILAHSSALTAAPSLFPNLGYDTARDLASVLMLGSSANVMITPVTRPWKTVQEFITEAKAKPGSISFGSVGIGSAVHISSEKFKLAAGIEATHVP